MPAKRSFLGGKKPIIIAAVTVVVLATICGYYWHENHSARTSAVYLNKVPKTLPPVFKGFFKNTDYSNPNDFLYCGPQTKADSEILQIARSFNNKKDFSTIEEIWRWLHQNVPYRPGDSFGRTAAEIIRTRISYGCTDYGLAFAALARAKGISTVFVQTARIDWIKELVANNPDDSYVVGHILVEVYLGRKWYLVDSTAGKLFLNYNKDDMSLDDGYYVFAKSIKGEADMSMQENNANMVKLFHGFNVGKYAPPLYEYINLSNGTSTRSIPFKVGGIPVILGPRAAVEAFHDKYFAHEHYFMGSNSALLPGNLVGAPYVVELYVKGTKLPAFLWPDFEQIGYEGLYDNGHASKTTLHGQTRILVMGDTDQIILKTIEKLPADFLSSRQSAVH